jgi:DNA-binding HxlR family transcriptional regulator
MRSYHQQCALAKALDVVGDRWTLLVIRELMIRDACRYTDLLNGLPGIATNLLTERLKELAAAGVITREEAPPPIATALFRLTPRGEALEPAIAALGWWGRPLLEKDVDADTFRDHWVILPLRLYVRDQSPGARPITLALKLGNEQITLETTSDGSVRVEPGKPTHRDALIDGEPRTILALLSAKLSLAAARAKGLHYEGDPKILRRFAVDNASKVIQNTKQCAGQKI